MVAASLVVALLRKSGCSNQGKEMACPRIISPMTMKKSVVFKVAVTLAVAAVSLWLWQELRVDSCLDRGRRWNYEISSCEGATGH